MVKPNHAHRYPVTEMWPDSIVLPSGVSCQMSRIAIKRPFRRHGLLAVAIRAARDVGGELGGSYVLGGVLSGNIGYFLRHGFRQLGEEYCDSTVDPDGTGLKNSVPVIMDVV
jgi:hypothetical protein